MSLFLAQSTLSLAVSAYSSETSFRLLNHVTRRPSMAAGRRRQQSNSTCLSTDRAGVVEDERMSFGLLREKMPRHVGLTIDGNRRWAVGRGLPKVAGYDACFRRIHEIVRLCLRCDIHVLSIFCMAQANIFKRPQVELDYFFNCFERFLEDLVQHRSEDKVRISVIGNMAILPKRLQEAVRTAEEMTEETNSELHLVLAMGYDDVVAACKSIATKAKTGMVDPESITQQMVEQELKTNCCEFPYPDLLIRPGGEQRISDFMLFQSAYAELYFDHHLMPEFGEEQFLEALKWFQERSRRFGV